MSVSLGQNDLANRIKSFYASRAMDLSKYPIEKLVYFAAGIIPGFTALLIYRLAVPGSFEWFFTLGFLGYKTKLSLVLLLSFVIGNSLTTFLNGFFGAIGGVLAQREARQPYKLPHTYAVAPWRDRRWRVALKNYLGTDAPNDSNLLTEASLRLRHQQIDNLPVPNQPLAYAQLDSEKIATELDDMNWANWYDQYHQFVLFHQQRDFQWHVHQGLLFNLETTGLYLLISAVFVPSVRHWWCIAPACMWVLILIAVQYSTVQNYRNKWSTLSEQIKYLIAQQAAERTSN